jgi:hypothetical protein
MKSSVQSLTLAAIEERPSPGFGAMGEMRRLRTFPLLPLNGEVRPIRAIRGVTSG